MKGMSLRQAAASCGGKLIFPQGRKGAAGISEDTEILSAELDSRKVTEGTLFFAMEGEHTDGHRFIGSAYEKGAYCVVTQKEPEQVEREYQVPASCWGAYILVEDAMDALRRVAEYYRTTLSIPIVGITGSVGKTSTKEFIASVLSVRYRVLKTEGNNNTQTGVPLTILRIREKHQAAVVEMGISDFGEMEPLSRIVKPNVCVVTNIGPCHLENLKDRDGVLREKSKIFEFMAPDGAVCLNGEDDKLLSVRTVKGKPVRFFGLGGSAGQEVYAADVKDKGLLGSEAMLHVSLQEGGEEVFPVTVRLPGAHMVLNAAAAAAVGHVLGLTKEEIAEGIGKVEPVEGRGRLVRRPGYLLIDDCYNANPVSMRAALDLLRQADNRKIAILGDMFELGEASDRMHEKIGEYAARAGIQRIVCVGEKAGKIYEGAIKAGAEDCLYFADKAAFLAECAQNGARLLPPESTILVKASHGMEFPEIVRYLTRAFESWTAL